MAAKRKQATVEVVSLAMSVIAELETEREEVDR